MLGKLLILLLGEIVVGEVVVREVAVGEVVNWESVNWGSCQMGKLSIGEVVNLGSCQLGKLSIGEVAVVELVIWEVVMGKQPNTMRYPRDIANMVQLQQVIRGCILSANMRTQSGVPY